ncbi:MAG: Uma2 family endonuclease [Cyanobacterium sp. T60_A2020_053]|nr:Uma2 family endonuclease [Cyanobacterium sp. T60_A2020_053]
MITITPSKRKFDLEEYHSLINVGIFHEDSNIELINGELFEMSPVGFRHASCVKKLNYLFAQKLPKEVIIGVQDPIKLNDKSEPQPDVILLKPRDDFYVTQHPTPEDIYLLIEVADSSIDYDRNIKLPAYAENKIMEVWLIDLNNSLLEKYTSPKYNYYQKMEKLSVEDTIFVDNFPSLKIAINEVL